MHLDIERYTCPICGYVIRGKRDLVLQGAINHEKDWHKND